MRLLKDFALFAVEEIGVTCVVFLMCFSMWATKGLIRAYCAAHYMQELLFALAFACVIFNVMMMVGAVKLVYDCFQEFRRERRETQAE